MFIPGLVVIKLEGGTDEDLEMLDELLTTPTAKQQTTQPSTDSSAKVSNGTTAAVESATTNADADAEMGEDGEVPESAAEKQQAAQAQQEMDAKPEIGESGELAEPDSVAGAGADEANKRRALHQSHSLFLPNVPVAVDKEKLLEVSVGQYFWRQRSHNRYRNRFTLA